MSDDANRPAMTSAEVRAFALKHDHLAIPIRPGVTITWTDEETGEILGRATLKGRNVVMFPCPTGEASSAEPRDPHESKSPDHG